MLTGFLGSGKSTLLNAMLRSPSMPRTAIIMNEFGEVAIDHALIEGVVEGVTLLGSGCVCCAVRSDLEGALRDLHLKRLRGLIPEYQAVILETTGLADPGPVLQTLTSRSAREFRYSLGLVVATVDAAHGPQSLSRHHEAVQQLAVADRIILTKVDLVEDVGPVVAAVRAINSAAPIIPVVAGNASPADVFGDAPFNPERSFVRSIDRGAHRHSSGIASYGRIFDCPLDWEVVESRLQAFLRNHGTQVLRLKALLWLKGLEQPVALHAVHHTLYQPTFVTPSSGERRSRMAIIGDHLDVAAAEAVLDAVAASAE